jgi:DNA-binding transcriptional MerR regulator
MKTLDALKHDLHAAIDEVQQHIERLKDKHDDNSEHAKHKLSERKEEMQKQLHELQSSGDEKSDDYKQKIEDSMANWKQSWNNVLSKLKF